MRYSKIKILPAAFVLVLSIAAGAQADPLFFSNTVALQNNGATSVDLFSNSGTLLVGPQISFLVDITGTLPTGVTDTLLLTFTEEGQAPQQQTIQIPLFDFFPPPYTQIFTFTILNAAFQPQNATLRIDILGSSPDFIIPSGPQAGARVDSYTYSFQVAQPVPEPAALVLAGVGLAGLLARRWRRKA